MRLLCRTAFPLRRELQESSARHALKPVILTSTFSTTSKNASDAKQEFIPGPRWLSETSARIGKCLTFGCSTEQVAEAGFLLEELGTNWRDLTVGSEGYLTEHGRRGLWKQGVVWGEQDAMGINVECRDHTYALHTDDSIGHVNNVSYLRYCESARVNWVQNFANVIDPANKEAWEELVSSRGYGVIIRSIKIDFKFPMQYPDRICAFHRLRNLPEAEDDSLFLDAVVISEKHRRPVARAVEDLVLYNYRDGKKARLDARPFMLDVFRQTYKLQEDAASRNRQRAKAMEEKVRALEQGSWDREGAVESFGSSGSKQ